MEYGLVAVWLVALFALSGLAFPLAARLFPRWPTAGLGLSLPVALLTLGVTAFWVGRVAYGYPALIAGLLVLAALAAVVGLDRDRLRALADAPGETTAETLRRTLVESLPFDRDTIDRVAVVETVVVFLLAFSFLVALRAADPGILPKIGEKFLDYGLLKTLSRADTLPPEDMWFAGEGVRYYYGGHLLNHLLGLLTGTAPQYVYNLGLATFFAAYVTAAFDLAGAIAATRGYSRRIAGWSAAFFVGFAGNLQTAGRLLLQSLPPGLQSAAISALQPHVAVDLNTFLNPEIWGITKTRWEASRVIDGTINEFPLFAFLNGDLHAHMMGPSLLLLAAALAFALYQTGTAGSTEAAASNTAQERRRRRLILFGLVPVSGGFHAVVHTWAFPTVFGLAWLGLALSPTPPRSLLPAVLREPLNRRLGTAGSSGESAAVADGSGATVTEGDSVGTHLANELTRPLIAAALVGITGVMAVVVASPFLLSASQSGSSRELAILAVQNRSGFGGLLLVHGAFVLAFGGYLLDRLGDDRPGEVVLAFAVLLWVANYLSLPALAVVGSLLLGGWIAVRSDRAGFETVLIVGGAGLVLLVEIVFLDEQAGPGRMNTVFKTYSQVWAIWAPAIGVAIAGLLRDVESPTVWPTPSARRIVSVVLVVALVGASGAYASQTMPDHFTGGDPDREPTRGFATGYPEKPTLNGTDALARYHPDMATAINYLDKRPGQPTILSAPATGRYPGSDQPFRNPPGMYEWESSPGATFSGLPTVAGWHHEVGYRGPEVYLSRVREVDSAYTNRTAAVEVIRTYDVQYVWVGDAESARYGMDMIEFESLPGVTAVVETDSVTVYRVDHDALPGENEDE
jgi:YYY domain-containing protein